MVIYEHDGEGPHGSLKAVEKKLRASIDGLNDARIYFADDPSDRNLLLLRQAKLKVRRAEDEKAELLAAFDDDDTIYPWD